jgi:hypothetical protein
VQKAYGNETVNRSNVFRWYSRFGDGREPVEDDGRGGRPKSTRTEVNISAVAELDKNDRPIASRMIAESLNIPNTVYRGSVCLSVCMFRLEDTEIVSRKANFKANARV